MRETCSVGNLWLEDNTGRKSARFTFELIRVVELCTSPVCKDVVDEGVGDIDELDVASVEDVVIDSGTSPWILNSRIAQALWH